MGQVLKHLAIAIGAAAAISFAPDARAAGADERKAETLFREGRAAVDKGDWKTGCDRFAESLKLAESAGPLVNLAQCDERRGDLVAALAHWKRGIALLPPNDERTAPARDRVAALDKRVPRLTIALEPGTPDGARVIVDGVDVDRAVAAAPTPYNPGAHTVVVSAPGRSEWRATLVLVDGDVRNVTAVLPPVGLARVETGPSGLRIAGFVVGAAGVASLAVGLVTGGLTIAKKGVVDDNCGAHGCNDAAREASLAGRTLSAVSTATFVVGLAGIGAGVVMIIVGRPKAPPATAIAPWAPPGGAGLSLTQRF